MRRSIIVGVDGSSESTDAAVVAASLARSLDRRLVLAQVVADPMSSITKTAGTVSAAKKRARRRQ